MCVMVDPKPYKYESDIEEYFRRVVPFLVAGE